MDTNNNPVIYGFIPPDINPDNLPSFKIQVDPRPPLHPDDGCTKKRDRDDKRSKDMEEGICDFQQHKKMKSETGPHSDHVGEKTVEDTFAVKPLPDTLYYVDEIKNKTEEASCTTQPTEGGTGIYGYIEPETIQPSPAVLRSEEELSSNKGSKEQRIFAYRKLDGSVIPNMFGSNDGLVAPNLIRSTEDEGDSVAPNQIRPAEDEGDSVAPNLFCPAEDEGFYEPDIFNDEKPKRQ